MLSIPPPRLLILAALAGAMLACEHSSTGTTLQTSLPHGLRPTFSITENSPPDSTGCTYGVAYLRGQGDVASLTAQFFAPDSSNPRTECGALPFNESPGNPGSVTLATVNGNVGYPYQGWSLGTRATSSDTLAEDSLERWEETVHTNTYDAPANDQYDQTTFGYRHSSTYSDVFRWSYEITAIAQLWRVVPAPSSFSVTRADSHAVLSWSNPQGLLRRHVDSTEVWRHGATGSWGADPISTLDSASTGYSDVPGPGKWYYMIRFVSGRPAYEAEDTGLEGISRPRSATSPAAPDTGLTIGAPAPPWFRCEGNFDPDVDCEWTAGSSSASTQVFRDGALRATLAAGVTTWNDSPVTRHTSYIYKARHIADGAPGFFSAPDTVVADPLAPEGLSCAGTTDTEVTCVWANKENEITQIWRRVGNRPQWSLLDEVAAGENEYVDSPVTTGTTYWYKVRYRRGSEYTPFSNEDDAHPGQPGDPLRPIRP